MMDVVITLLIQIGIGSIIGVVLGVVLQYFISKKLRVFETKLEIFRRVYKQLYYFTIMNHEEISSLSDDNGSGVFAQNVAIKSGLDLKTDLGDILYYVDGDLEDKISKLIYTLYFESGVINKDDINEITLIMTALKKYLN